MVFYFQRVGLSSRTLPSASRTKNRDVSYAMHLDEPYIDLSAEKATIFSQGLIVTRKLNKLWLHVFFDEQYDEEKDFKSDEAKMKPIYMGNHVGDEPEVIPIVRNQALMDAALSGVDDMTFGVSDPTHWSVSS